jgi:hypothetical protein
MDPIAKKVLLGPLIGMAIFFVKGLWELIRGRGR